MSSVPAFVTSSVGKKFLSGFTGLALVGFVAAHLAGNLLLFVGADAFNSYAYFLEHLGHGAVIYIAEAGLILFFLVHAVSGISVALKKRRARSQPYFQTADAGGVSRKGWSSQSMIVTGLVLLVFVILHVKMFKFGPAEPVTVNGKEMRDLYSLVVLSFKVPWIALAYTVVMIMLGVHLRHGVWSAFQSLGATNPKFLPLVRTGGLVLAILIAVGFVLLPLCILFWFESPMPVGGV